jgi:hypothetical protein
MTERVREELELIRTRYPDLEYREEDQWARVRAYPVPPDWGAGDTIEVAFRMPANPLGGEQPYGFWVRPALSLNGGSPPTNSSGPVATGFGHGWQQFSWAPELWRPNPVLRKGTTMLDFVRSFAERLGEVN